MHSLSSRSSDGLHDPRSASVAISLLIANWTN